MKVNPTKEEKGLLSSKMGSGILSGLSGKSKSLKRQDKRACNKLLRKIVDGQAATIIMSLITLYALFGVLPIVLLTFLRMISVCG